MECYFNQSATTLKKKIVSPNIFASTILSHFQIFSLHYASMKIYKL